MPDRNAVRLAPPGEHDASGVRDCGRPTHFLTTRVARRRCPGPGMYDAFVAIVEHHDEAITPFQRQLGWHLSTADPSLVEAERVFMGSGQDSQLYAAEQKAFCIGVGNGFRRPLPPNPVCGFPATGSPVSCFRIGIGAPI